MGNPTQELCWGHKPLHFGSIINHTVTFNQGDLLVSILENGSIRRTFSAASDGSARTILMSSLRCHQLIAGSALKKSNPKGIWYLRLDLLHFLRFYLVLRCGFSREVSRWFDVSSFILLLLLLLLLLYLFFSYSKTPAFKVFGILEESFNTGGS